MISNERPRQKRLALAFVLGERLDRGRGMAAKVRIDRIWLVDVNPLAA
jgi:hypothetical protein